MELRFWIPIRISGIPESLSYIPDSKAQDYGLHKQTFPRFRNPDSWPYMGRPRSQTYYQPKKDRTTRASSLEPPIQPSNDNHEQMFMPPAQGNEKRKAKTSDIKKAQTSRILQHSKGGRWYEITELAGGRVLIPHSRSFSTKMPHPALFFIAFLNPVFFLSKIRTSKKTNCCIS